MKQLQLELNKRLLIVEFDDMQHLENVISCDKQGIRFCTDDDQPTKPICNGDEFTEDIAKTFIPIHEKGASIKYPKAFLVSYNRFTNAFIDVIQSAGYHWGENPEPSHYDYQNDDCETDFTQFNIDHKKWQESESRTFAPSKCIICEIL